MKETLKNNELPLWTPYFYSGRPLFAQPEYYFIDFNLLLILLTGNIYVAMNFAVIAHFFLAGFGMYLLVLYFTENKAASFISALIYMFNGFMHTFIVPGNIMVMEGYSLIPFILLFVIKALKNKNFVINSLIAGLLTALLIFVGGVIFLPYLFTIILAYSLFYIIDKNISSRIVKLIIVGFLMAMTAFTISAIKLLPDLEFMSLSNRGRSLPFEEYLGEPIKIKNFDYAFISNKFFTREHISAAIGIVGFVLIIFSLYKFSNRAVLFSLFLIVLSLFMSTESFLTKLLYKLPFFNQARHVERAIFMFAFASPILAGFGFLNLQSLVKKWKKINNNIVFVVIAVLILAELMLMQNFPKSSEVIQPNEIPVLEQMRKDKGLFRTINNALSTFVGATGYNYYAQLGISEIKGGSGIWFNDYLEYLAIAQSAPAKMLGVLNNKYVISDKNISIDGLGFVDKFNECEDCAIREAFGPYLYKNEFFLPRYYIVSNAILVIGERNQAKQIIYALMLQNWEINNNVFVQGSKIDDFSMGLLNKVNAIILTDAPQSQESFEKLKQFKSKGGKIIPDILDGKSTVSNQEIIEILDNFKGDLKEMEISRYTNNKVTLSLNNEKGWLVASERFAYFPGWKASINGKNVGIFKANNIISAIYLNGEKGELTFEYEPNSYKRGKLISIIAFILIVIYFGYFVYKKKFNTMK